ncbi:type II secretion system protein GspD [Cyanobium sp. Tous-M-B4]|uniref:type II secretion system protein GspD n=1 Tax=Cyanobium sp. Tous-M-B4 TaxID=2823724 RepID=UPI0020CDBCE8|nr:type II and III secretion system protein [Cyanobium sp. Tous-M-B4]
MLPVIALAEAAVQAAPRTPGAGTSVTGSPSAKAAEVPATGPLQLKVRRLSDSVELVIEGAGLAPQLQQSSGANGWQGLLTTATPSGLRVGPQRLSMPELGFQTITLDGSGSSYRVGVTPVAGAPLGRPVVSGDGVNMIISFPASAQVSLPVARFNARQPGYIPQATFAPPLQPRAVAPPLGDMAVGSMTLRNPGYLNLSGPAVTMTLKNAPAKDALMALAQVGGYGFAYVAEADAANPAAGGVDAGSTRISLAFRGESYGRAFNTALLAAGLQGRREGNMILAGPKALSKTFGPQLSKVYRLNQVGPNAAADYLANLGATVTKTNTITTSVTQGVAQGEAVSSGANSQTTQSSSITNVEAYGASSGPLLGLRATTDTRLGTITLVGDPVIVSVAEQYLKQLDLRQRQVALSVRILDVNLDNVSEIDNSFAFKWGNNFIVNDSGQLLGAFGQNLPPGEGAFDRQSSGPLESIDRSSSSQSTSSLVVDRSRDLSLTRSQLRDINSELQSATGFKLTEAGERLVVVPVDSSSETLSDSTKRSIERILSRNTGRSVSTSRSSGNVFDRSVSGTVRPNPGSLYSDNTFFDFVRAQIVSGSTKLLASPTLILQENPSLLREGSEAAASSGSSQAASQGITNIGLDSAIGRRRANEGVVRVGTNVVTGYETETPSQGGNVVCTPELSTAGLVLGARVEKIDDNGFVTFVLSPSVSAVTNQEVAPQGCGSNLNILSIRSLDTGALRVRDGQTLIMTGVISEFDRTEVSKWPILGDMPLIGQFFRSSSGRKEKRELVIMVSPRIVNDDQGGVYGYGYQPGTAAGREFFGAMNGPGGN